MLVIRKEQMEAFEQDAERRFEKRTVEHLQESFMLHCDIMGEPALYAVARYGIDRAESYNLTDDDDIWLYLDLMFMLGSDFDRDPQLPWAAEILNDDTIPDPGEKLELLYEQSVQFLDGTAGVESEHLNDALHRISEYPWTSWPGDSDDTFEQQIFSTLERIYPEKYRALEEQGTLHDLIAGAREKASSYGVTDGWGVMVFTVLMFMLGSAFDTDAQFPWAAKALNDPTIGDPAMRANLLYSESMSYLDRLLGANTGKEDE